MCDCSEECRSQAERSKYPRCVIERRAYERKKKALKKKQIIDYLGGECVDCGMKAAVVDKVMAVGGNIFAPMIGFDVEHTNWKKKTNNISWMSSNSWQRIKQELDDGECVLLCKICHAARTKKLHSPDSEFRKRLNKKQLTTWNNGSSSASKALNTSSG